MSVTVPLTGNKEGSRKHLILRVLGHQSLNTGGQHILAFYINCVISKAQPYRLLCDNNSNGAKT